MHDDDDGFRSHMSPNHVGRKLVRKKAKDGKAAQGHVPDKRACAQKASLMEMPASVAQTCGLKVGSRPVEAKKEAMLPDPERRRRFLTRITRNEGHFPGYLPSHP
jgi:hypothetical protein